jgi:type II secretory pathway predicted ATPase ExeA
MDWAYWGLSENPYRITLSPGQAALLPNQVRAAEQITRAFTQGERVALLLGPSGIGKTSLAQQLVAKYEAEGMHSAWAACVPVVGSQALLQMLLADFGQPFSLRSTVELRMQLVEHLLPLVSENRSTIIVVDEAQYVPASNLEELRPLVEIVSPNGRPGVHVLLVGADNLHESLSQAAGLDTWVGVRHTLKRLNQEEAIAYLTTVWKKHGGHPKQQATEEAWSMIAELSQGLPLFLNRLARQSFLLAREVKEKCLDAEMVWEAAHELGLVSEEPPDEEMSETVPLVPRPPLKESA